jgi:hypothetical protein
MSTQQVSLHGEIQPDGTLQIEEKINLPPGPVNVTVEAIPTAARRRTMQVLEEIWAERKTRGIVGRGKEEIIAEINAMRAEDEERMSEIDSIHRQSREKD